ncbi:MAG: ABC transporter permease [Thermoanaerobaculia bacterium]|nr:ABC transporter permease [Thermoanaerobaculia bacterium]
MTHPKSGPPRVAEWLLRRRLPRDLSEPILGDLAERFGALSETDPVEARRFYWRQTVSAWSSRIPAARSPIERAGRFGHRRTASGLDSWGQDLRYGARRLMRSPGFSLVALFTLALGIGATTTIFSVVQETLLRSLPFADPERLVMVWNHTREEPTDRWLLTAKDFADMQEQSRSLEAAAVTETVVGPMVGAGEAIHVRISRTTTNFFSLLGVEPILGRGFVPEDGTPVPTGAQGPPLPVLLSHGTWQAHFGGDPGVLGRTMTIFGQPAEVIGVMPVDFDMHLPDAADVGRDMDLWWPIRYDHSQGSRDSHYLTVIARLRDGTSLSEARAETISFSEGIRQASVRHRELGLEFELTPLAADVVAHVRPTLVLLSGAVGFVLLIACANVASLFLVRVARRRSELAVMSALGAGRWRLIRQLLTESLLLGVAGGTGGLLLSVAGLSVLKRVRPDELPWVDAVQLDLRIVAFALGTSLLAALVYGIAPAIRSTVAAGRLQQRAGSSSAGESRLRSSMVVVEVALSLVLLVGAGLMVRTIGELNRVELGFDPENLLVVDVSMPGQLDREQRLQVVHEVERTLREVPGVEQAGGIFPVPLNGVYVRTCAYAADAPPLESEDPREAYFRIVTPGYFDAARVSLRAGRQLEASDEDGEPAVVVVEQRLADRLWPGHDPIGQRLFFQIFSRQPVEVRVAGVVDNVRQGGLIDERPTIYMPRHFYAAMEMSFVVRAQGDPERLYAPIRSAIGALPTEMPVDVRAMSDNVVRELRPAQFVLALMAVFSALALVLAAVGLYGVLAYSVSQRRREIGIRLAMGATRHDVLRLVLGEGMVLAALGTLFGLGAAAALTRFMSHHLYGVSATDPVAFGATAAFLLMVSGLATWLPARRASGVAPSSALRYE